MAARPKDFTTKDTKDTKNTKKSSPPKGSSRFSRSERPGPSRTVLDAFDLTFRNRMDMKPMWEAEGSAGLSIVGAAAAAPCVQGGSAGFRIYALFERSVRNDGHLRLEGIGFSTHLRRWEGALAGVVEQARTSQSGEMRIAAWYPCCVVGGFASGFAAAVLALVISGSLFMPGLDWVWAVPLVAVPVLGLTVVARWRPRGALAHIVIGVVLFAGLAFLGEFFLGVLIARADHG